MVAVAYRRWSFTRGSNCKASTGNVLVFRIGGRLWDVIAYERWSHMEVRLYLNFEKATCVTHVNSRVTCLSFEIN